MQKRDFLRLRRKLQKLLRDPLDVVMWYERYGYETPDCCKARLLAEHRRQYPDRPLRIISATHTTPDGEHRCLACGEVHKAEWNTGPNAQPPEQNSRAGELRAHVGGALKQATLPPLYNTELNEGLDPDYIDSEDLHEMTDPGPEDVAEFGYTWGQGEPDPVPSQEELDKLEAQYRDWWRYGFPGQRHPEQFRPARPSKAERNRGYDLLRPPAKSTNSRVM